MVICSLLWDKIQIMVGFTQLGQYYAPVLRKDVVRYIELMYSFPFRSYNSLEREGMKWDTLGQLFSPRRSIFLGTLVGCVPRDDINFMELCGYKTRQKKIGATDLLTFLRFVRSGVAPPSHIAWIHLSSLKFLPRTGSVAHLHPSISLFSIPDINSHKSASCLS